MSQPETVDSTAINVSAFGISDVGRVRKNNEDNFVIFNLSTSEQCQPASLCQHALGPLGTLFLVADGMGGEASGEVASSIVAENVPHRLHEGLKSLETVTASAFAGQLRQAVEHANSVIFQQARVDRTLRGMGTTTTAAALFGPYLFVAQVGDSRAYLNRNGVLVQLTRDQTFLNYLADIGAELPEDLENDSRKSILTQAVGTSESVDAKMTYAKVMDGDRILLCSDGLYNMVKTPGLSSVVNDSNDLAGKCHALIGMARDQGGTDNITAVMAEIHGPGLGSPDSTEAVDVRPYRDEDFAG
ncbi:MAG TPA: protein phosphatase 2C domain-containing protein [Terriglobia bacterium]|nr:protein phosphatase 2C domain-containing protein [Terriglobia bacterium]